MISDRRRGSNQAWTSRAKALSDQVEAARSRKVNLRDLARKLKADNFENLADCVMLEDIEALLAENRIPKTAEATELVGKLQAYAKEGTDLRAAAEAAKEKEEGDIKAKEAITEAVKLRISCAEIESLKKEAAPAPEVEQPETMVEELAVIETSLKELKSQLSGKKGKKKIDEELQKRVEEHKEDIEKVAGDLQTALGRPYYEITRESVEDMKHSLSRVGLSLEEVPSLDLKLELSEIVLNACNKLVDMIDAMDEETSNLGHRLKVLLEEASSHHRYVVDIKMIRDLKEKVQDIMKKLKIKDDSLKSALEYTDSIIWFSEARKLLNDPSCDQNDIEDLVSKKPKSLHASELITELNSKAVTSNSSGEDLEKEIHSALKNFFDSSDLTGDGLDTLKRYVERMRKRPGSEKITRMLDLADKAVDLYEKGVLNDCDQLIEAMFEMKFYGTKTFGYIEELQNNGDRLKNDTAAINQNITRYKKWLDKNKGTSWLTLMREGHKVEVSTARELIALVSSLSDTIKKSYSSVVETMVARIDALDKLKNKVKDLKNKYSKLKHVAGKAEGAVSDLEKTAKEYCQLDLGCEDFKKELENCCWMVKAFCALDGKTYDGSSKTLDGWKKIMDNIGEWADTLVHAMDKKYQIAKHFVREVEKMRQLSGQPKANKEKLPSLNEADTLLKELFKHCKEMDLNIERNFMEGIVNNVQSKLKVFQTDQPIMLHDLQTSLDYLKRAPLNLKEETSEYLDTEKRAGEFLQRVRELSPEQFVQKQSDLQVMYSGLGVKVLEWEVMIQAVAQEEKVKDQITNTIDSRTTDLNQIQDIREQYKNIRYLKDTKMEVDLLLMYLDSLQAEYERRQDIIVREESLKPAIDFLLLGALIGELDDLLHRLKTHDGNLKAELYALHEKQRFFHDLHADTKRYLEFNIFSLTLDQLNSQATKKLHNKFVDIRGPTLDYKINLEIQEREKHQVPKTLFNAPVHLTKRQPLVLESKYTRETERTEQNENWNAGDDRKGLGRSGEHGKPSYHGPRDDNSNTPSKPAIDKEIISEELRNYYAKSWKNLMESNSHLEISGLDALMASRSLEKAIYDKIKQSPIEYDVLCTSITTTLRHILHMRNISTHLRNEGFKPNVLMVYCDKTLPYLKKMENNLKNSDSPGVAAPQSSQVPGRRRPQSREYPRTEKPPVTVLENTPEEIQYKNYNIFNGGFQLEAGESIKAFDSVELC